MADPGPSESKKPIVTEKSEVETKPTQPLKPIITSHFLNIYETATVLFNAVELVSRAFGGTLFGEKINNVDIRLEAIRLLKERKLPFIIEREIIPGDPTTREQIDVRELMLNEAYLDEVSRFIYQNSVNISDLREEDLSALLENFTSLQEQQYAKELTGDVSEED